MNVNYATMKTTKCRFVN